MPKSLPSAESLRATFRYDPHTGQLYWRARADAPPQWNTRFAGRIAGFVGQAGIAVRLKGYKALRAHRIIWKMVHGDEPEEIDHVDCNPLNNRLVNLRRATRRQNAYNRRLQPGASGFKGVSFDRGRWRARIRVNGRSKFLGRFDTAEAAHAAYRRAPNPNFAEFGLGPPAASVARGARRSSAAELRRQARTARLLEAAARAILQAAQALAADAAEPAQRRQPRRRAAAAK
jgi:hypothetical protein